MHRILLREVVVDVPGAGFDAARDFWAAALDARARLVDDHQEFTSLRHPAALSWVGLQRLGEGPARLHLDLESDDVPAEVDRLTALGATVVDRARAWVVMRDPAGLPFCVLPPESPEFATRSRLVGGVDEADRATVPTVRDARPDDLDALAERFESWPKPRTLFVDYLAQADAGTIDFMIAERAGGLAGYTLIRWTSGYRPFADAGIPEICDLAVLADHRRHGAGNALMDEAESRIGLRGDRAGIGVGLYGDYGSAQRMYVRRGYLPDGAGLVIDGTPVPAGTVIVLDNEPELMLTKQVG